MFQCRIDVLLPFSNPAMKLLGQTFALASFWERWNCLSEHYHRDWKRFFPSPWNASVTLFVSFKCRIDVWGSGDVFGSQLGSRAVAPQGLSRGDTFNSSATTTARHEETSLGDKYSFSEFIQSASAENNRTTPEPLATWRLGESRGNNQCLHSMFHQYVRKVLEAHPESQQVCQILSHLSSTPCSKWWDVSEQVRKGWGEQRKVNKTNIHSAISPTWERCFSPQLTSLNPRREKLIITPSREPIFHLSPIHAFWGTI